MSSSTDVPEAQTSQSSSPAAASSPHQREAISGSSHKQSMKDCIAKQQSTNSSMSNSDAKKACKQQMKDQG